MHKVKSSNIDHLEYDSDTKTLIVAFKNGTRYSYADVPEKAFNQLKDAESVGSHFAKSVKSKYKHKLLPKEEKKQEKKDGEQ